MRLTPPPKVLKRLGGKTELEGKLRVECDVDFAPLRVVESLAREFLGDSGLRIRVTSDTSVMASEEGADRLLREDEAYALIVNGDVVVVARGLRGIVYGLVTLRQFLREASGAIGNVLVADWPGFKYRGVVEGFYYDPWSWSDRLDVLRFMACYKMNSYIYAPKDDPYHREKWRLRYPEELLNGLRRLASAASRYGVELVFAVSPGLSVTYSSDDDVEALVEKMLEVAELGVRSFGVFFDDIPKRLLKREDEEKYEGLAEAQADFTNRVLRRLREELGDVRLVVTPTEYAGVELGPYFDTLAQELDSTVELLWTGPEVCSKEIPLSAAEKVSARAGGRLLVWDNYPVNDYARNRLNLDPLQGRDPRLPRAIRGFYFNPMNEAHASMIPLASAAAYTWSPDAYEPWRDWRTALRLEYGAACDVVEFLADQLGGSTLWPRVPEYVDALLRSLRERGPSDDLMQYLQRLARLSHDILRLPRSLRNEVWRYAYKLSLYGLAGLRGLRACGRVPQNEGWLNLVEMLRVWRRARSMYEIVGCASLHEEPQWRTYVVRDFLDELMTEIARWAVKSLELDLLVPHVFSTMDHFEGTDAWQAFDGDTQTYFVSRRFAKKGDTLEIRFERDVYVEAVIVYQRTTAAAHEPLEFVVEIRRDGDWEEVCRVSEGRVRVGGSVKAVRLRLEEAADRRALVALVTVETGTARVYTSMSSTTLPLNVVDARLDTEFRAVHVRKGDWIVLDFGSVKRTEEVVVLQDPLDCCPLRVMVPASPSDLIVYFDKALWQEAGIALPPLSAVKLRGVESRYVKLEATRDVPSLKVRCVRVRFAKD